MTRLFRQLPGVALILRTVTHALYAMNKQKGEILSKRSDTKSLQLRNIYKLSLILIIFLLCISENSAQDLSNIASAKPVVLTGSVFAGTSYASGPSQSELSPYGYNLGANLSLDFYGVFQLPFSFTFSNYGTDYSTMSFRRFGISPSYKKFKFHLGYRSYQLSPYILSGMTTLGAGAEYNGEKFRILLFYGKIMDQLYTGSNYVIFNDPDIKQFTRWNFGTKIGFGKPANSVNLHIFRAIDRDNTGSSDFLLKNQMYPMENLSIGIDLKQQIFKVLTFTANGASSFLTHNTGGRDIDGTDEEEKWIAYAAPFLSVNKTTRASFAYDAKLSLNVKGYTLGVKYQHVDPMYNTLGVSFLRKNVNSYLFDFGGGLFKRKLNLRGNVGLEYLNKGGFTGKEQKRIVYSFNAGLNLSRQFTMQAYYNNMTQNTLPSLEEVGDSLVFTANSKGLNTSFNYTPGKGKVRPHSIRGGYSRNTFDIVSAGLSLNANSNSSANVGYNYNIKDGWRAGGGINYSLLSSADERKTRRYGLNANIGRNFLEIFSTNFTASYRLNSVNGIRDGNVITTGFQVALRSKNKHNLSMNINYLMRNTTILKAKNELRLRLNYSYAFSSNNKN